MEETRRNGYTPSESAHLRSLFEGWKDRLGIGSPWSGLVSDERFRRALESVVHEHGYSLSELAEWLGISRQRVHQWCEAASIDTPDFRGTRYRKWDGERFVPDTDIAPSTGIRTEARRRATARRKKTEARKRKQKRDAAVARIRDFVRTEGRVPSMTDMLRAEGLAAGQMSTLCTRYGIDRSTTNYKEHLDAVWKDAGFERPRW